MRSRTTGGWSFFTDRGGAFTNVIGKAWEAPARLGSRGDGVKAMHVAGSIDGRGLGRGDVYMLNSPDKGGMRLLDATVIRKVFTADGDPLAGAVMLDGSDPVILERFAIGRGPCGGFGVAGAC